MPEALLLGAIADDYTGATDLASMLREQGVRTGLVFGFDDDTLLAGLHGSYQAVVIALRSRSVPASEAVDASLRALERLRWLGARQVYFKYCSTFDSTADGNIGPVTEALMDAMDVDFTVAVPALPVNGRTQYYGYLFVGDRLLSESHMRHHPLTPMIEPDLVRHLQAQTRRSVGLIAHLTVRSGAAAICAEAARLRTEGTQIALVDALLDADLREIAEAVADLPLITGGSGLGITLPGVWARLGLLASEVAADGDARPRPVGALVLAGSCSAVTLEQLRVLREAGGDGIRIDVLRLLASAEAELERLSSEISERVSRRGWALVYSSAAPEPRARLLRAANERGLSPAEVGHLLEHAMGELARRAVEAGVVAGVVVAGGETSGAVTQALDIRAVEIGPALDAGVPAARAIGGRPLDIVFKSGNFGRPDFFLRALRHLGVAPEARQ